MKINKPKFWDDKIGFFAILLLPFSLAFFLAIFLRKKFTKSVKFKIPIICVGNIYLGGTGKTPVSIFLAKELLKIGKNPSIIRKYYKSHLDEFKLIKSNVKNLIINKTRTGALKEAEINGSDFAILDDGLQDYKIRKDLKIVCFNSNQLFGNGLILPSGPLRESLHVLKSADIVIINGSKSKIFEEKILNINNKLDIFYSFYKPVNLEKFKNKKLFAIAGIGNPKNFFKLLEENNLDVYEKLIFPDHYQFSKDEMIKIIENAKNKDCQIIMTEKDYYKINDYQLEELDYVKVSLEINQKEKLINKIRSKNVKSN
tara:strand:- start:3591 stop:4532 length:942 start_codon:yes stop_codon:yes gene_type:complete